jgi:predicted CopG family antitoxin
LVRRIAISDEVYELLKRSRLPGESFSGVIKRNLHKPKLSEIAGTGILTKEDWAETKKSLAESENITRQKLSRMG